MPRNKYPEETVKLILDTAARLFTEKGFEKTSLQDIMNETKPVSYTHLKASSSLPGKKSIASATASYCFRSIASAFSGE